MKYIFVTPYFMSIKDKELNGGLISNYYFAKAIKKKLKIYSVSCNVSSKAKEEFDMENINFKTSSGLIGYFFLNILFFKKLFLDLKKEKEEVTIISTTTLIAVSYLVSKLLKKRHIIISRAYEDFVYSKNDYGKTNKIKKIIKKIINLNLPYYAYRDSKIITNSKWMKEAIKDSFSTQQEIEILYPPLDLKLENTELKKTKIKKIGFINRGNIKGHELVYELAKINPKIIFNIYGDIQIFEKLKKISNLNLIGWRKREIIFKEIDLLLAPSKWPEPFGRISLEAQSYSIPCLVPLHGGLKETIVMEEFLVEKYSVEEWNKKLQDIKQNYQKLINELERRKKSLEKYNLKNHDKRVLEILQ